MCVLVIWYYLWHRQYSIIPTPQFFQLTVLCVIGRHRLLSPDQHHNSEGRNRSVFSKKNYRREFFAGKPEGLEREDFGLRVTLIKGLSRRCRHGLIY